MNCYINKFGDIIINNTLYQVPAPISKLNLFKQGKVVETFDSVISINNKHTKMYGHWIKDVLTPFMMLPQEVRDKSYFIIGGKAYYALESLDILGFDISKAIFLINDDDLIFAKECHTVCGEYPMLSHFGYSLLNLSRIFKQKLNLSHAKPSAYVLCNRPVNKRRHITNFNDLIQAVERQFFEYKWEIWIPQYESIKIAAKNWNNAKVLYSPTGSNLANAIFMQEFSALCTLCAEWYDYSVVGLCQVMCIYQVMYSFDKWKHFGDCSAPINIEYALEMIARTIYVVNNHQWPVI